MTCMLNTGDKYRYHMMSWPIYYHFIMLIYHYGMDGVADSNKMDHFFKTILQVSNL